jgi:aldehyde:ferredoxin oxidoreductase
VGPAVGFSIWGPNRYRAFTKSPLTGIFSESYSGEKAFLHVAKTGYDAIVISGTAEIWSYLEIKNQSVTFRDAVF